MKMALVLRELIAAGLSGEALVEAVARIEGEGFGRLDVGYAEWMALRASVMVGEPPCIYCGDPATEADHMMPLSRGGRSRLDNLAPACKPCNCSKKDRTYEEFLAAGGRKR